MFLLEDGENFSAYIRMIRRLRIDALSEAKREEDKEEDKEKEEIGLPNLSERDLFGIICDHVLTKDNEAATAFFKERKEKSTYLVAHLVEHAKLLKGSLNYEKTNILDKLMPSSAYTKLTKSIMAMMLCMPLSDIKALEKEQTLVKALVERNDFFEKLKKIYTEFRDLEDKILPLYDADKDPMLNPSYKKVLNELINSEKGRYTNIVSIEFYKRLKLDIVILSEVILLLNYIVKQIKLMFFQGASSKNIDFIDIFVFCWNTFIFGTVVVTLYKSYSRPLQYIAMRIAYVESFIALAQKLDKIIMQDPLINKLFGEKLSHTRQLLNQKHTKDKYNKLMERLTTTNFQSWNLFFSSTGVLLTTLTLLEENIHMLDEIFFEIGLLETYLARAALIKNENKYKHRYTFPIYEKSKNPSLTCPNIWNILIGPEHAVDNDLYIDGEKEKTLCITGPNACGKSELLLTLLWYIITGQSLGIVPANPNKKAKLSIFYALLMFKEPSENLAMNLSLFAMETNMLIHNLKIQEEMRQQEKLTAVFVDEFLGSTNKDEANALQYAYTNYLSNYLPNTFLAICSHNGELIKECEKSPYAKVIQTVIIRYPDGTYKPTYKIALGASDERVGIDLFEVEMKKYPQLDFARKKIITIARKRAKETTEK